jgi:hypothetical protein
MQLFAVLRSRAEIHERLASDPWTISRLLVTKQQRLMGQRDQYIDEMSAFDRSARMKTERELTAEEFLAFASGTVRAWQERDRRAVEAALSGVKRRARPQ